MKFEGAQIPEDESSAGFSLLEMMVVLAISSVLVSLVSLKSFNSVEAIRFDQTVKQIQSELRLQRVISVAENRSYIFLNGGSFTQELSNYGRFSLSDSVDISISGEPVIVLATGVCSSSELEVRSKDGRTARFYVLSNTCKLRRVNRGQGRFESRHNIGRNLVAV